MRGLLIAIGILLAANLGHSVWASSDSEQSSTIFASLYNACQLPEQLNREKIDALAIQIVDTLNRGDGDRFLELHTKWPKPKSDAERNNIQRVKKMIKDFATGDIAKLDEDDFQNFQYIGDVEGQEAFRFVYVMGLNGESAKKYDRFTLALNILFDGLDAGLVKTEFRFVSDMR
jgi:hypothetical protein